ncbi:MAG: hypothetical protein J6J60_10220 [Clostridia bacterium]|nr:hypothetical protein [Clostridia bacterium]
MLYNYGKLETNLDLSDFTGFTLTASEDDNNTLLLTNYEDGEEKNQFTIDPENDSIEFAMAEIYPIVKPDIEILPGDEDGDIDFDELPDSPEDFTDKFVLVEPDLMDIFEKNINDLPYVAEEDIYEEEDYNYEEALELKKAEAEEEDRAFERYEKFINYLQDN